MQDTYSTNLAVFVVWAAPLRGRLIPKALLAWAAVGVTSDGARGGLSGPEGGPAPAEGHHGRQLPHSAAQRRRKTGPNSARQTPPAPGPDRGVSPGPAARAGRRRGGGGLATAVRLRSTARQRNDRAGHGCKDPADALCKLVLQLANMSGKEDTWRGFERDLSIYQCSGRMMSYLIINTASSQ